MKVKKLIKKFNLNPKNLVFKVKTIMGGVFTLVIFFFLLQFFLISSLIKKIRSYKFLPRFVTKPLDSLHTGSMFVVEKLDRGDPNSIHQTKLIDLALKNMSRKRTRSLVTIGGMSIGIAAIVFLVSIGYGVQHMVTDRVASLKELKQANVRPSQASGLRIDDEVLERFKNTDGVNDVQPLISLVGRINLQNSITDVVVRGATTKYLESSTQSLLHGSFFDSNNLAVAVNEASIKGIASEEPGEVEGVATTIAAVNEEIALITFKILPGEWIRVRSGPTTDSKIIGYTRRIEGRRDGVEVWGGQYTSDSGNGTSGRSKDGRLLGKWIKAKVPLWVSGKCNPEEENCEDGWFKKMYNEEGTQVWKEGYFAELNLSIENSEPLGDVLASSINISDVLATTDQQEATSSSETGLTTDDNSLEDIEIAELLKEASLAAVKKEPKKLPLDESAKKVVIVNESVAELFNVDPKELVGKELDLSFVVVSGLIDSEEEKIQSQAEKYKVLGVLAGGKSPVCWVPFIDLRGLGITKYSQARVSVTSKSKLAEVRQQIESLGYKTDSVADTIAAIDSLFSTARIILTFLGMIALAVASLGMFNTLTVSLLERTREVGVMKAMGLKAKEARNLFLAESMVMGFFGGIFGIILGLLGGELLGLLLSLFSISKGQGMLNLTYLPLPFVLVIILLSLLVGFLTGLYPARRAKNISALNALRYE